MGARLFFGACVPTINSGDSDVQQTIFTPQQSAWPQLTMPHATSPQQTFIRVTKHAALFGGCALLAALMSSSSALAGCNSGNVADSILLTDAGCQASATATDSTAVGLGATASTIGATAIGRRASAGATGSVDGDTAVGYFAIAAGNATDAAVALGSFANANGGG